MILSNQKIPVVLSLLWIAEILILNGCTGLMMSPSPHPLGRQQIAGILSSFKQQGSAFHTLISSGTLAVESQGAQSDGEILIVARREPSSIRIEITHSWGRPLLHILVNGPQLDILSFTDKRHYHGRLGTPFLLKQIPFSLDPDLLWSLARAYPVLPPYHQAHSEKGDQITLTDEHKSEIQVMDLYPDSNLPQRVRLCRNGAIMSFSDFQDSDNLIYGKEIGLIDVEQTTRLTLEIRKMIFNRSVPDAIFQQEAPHDFQEVQL